MKEKYLYAHEIVMELDGRTLNKKEIRASRWFIEHERETGELYFAEDSVNDSGELKIRYRTLNEINKCFGENYVLRPYSDLRQDVEEEGQTKYYFITIETYNIKMGSTGRSSMVIKRHPTEYISERNKAEGCTHYSILIFWSEISKKEYELVIENDFCF